jgi:hypothetical protein
MTRRTTCIALAAAAIAVAPAGAAGTSAFGAPAARVVDCHARVDFNLTISSARNMRCRTARRDMRRYRGSIGRRFRTPGGFRCRRVSGGRLGGQWRCVRGRKAYRFEFGD